MLNDLTRPIIGIENRTAAEVFGIMCDRFRAALPKPADDVAGLVADMNYRVGNPSAWDNFDEGASEIIREAAAALSRMLAELEVQRNLQAALTARAKTMLRLRDVLAQVHDYIEDEGDRAYFGSTNDADILKSVWHELDGWAWEDIMSDGKLPDIYEASRKAHVRADTAEATIADRDAEIARLREVVEHDWEKVARAQSRKLHHVLAIPGVKEALAELKWDANEAARRALTTGGGDAG